MLINLPLHTRCAAGPSGGAGHESRGRRDVGCFPTTYPLCSRSQWQSRARVTGEKGCWLLPHYIPVVLSVPVAEQGPECRRGGEGMLAVSPLRTRYVAGPSGRAGPKVSSWGRRDVGRLPPTYPLCCRSQWQSRAQSVVMGEKGCWPSPHYVPVVLPVPVAEQGPKCRRGGEGMLAVSPLRTRCVAGPSGRAGPRVSSWGRRDVGRLPPTYPLCCRSQWQSRAQSVVVGEKGCWPSPHYVPVVLPVPVAEQGPECRHGGEGMLAVSPLRTRCAAGPSGRAGPKVSSWGRRDVGRLPTTYPLCCRSQWQSRAQSVVVGEKGCWPSPPYVPVVLPVPVAEQSPECRRGGEGPLHAVACLQLEHDGDVRLQAALWSASQLQLREVRQSGEADALRHVQTAVVTPATHTGTASYLVTTRDPGGRPTWDNPK